MTRSVEKLRLEAERNRAALTTTVEQLRGQLSETAEGLRQTVSPQHIKAEVSDYITDKTHGWLSSLKQHALENPLQTIATGTAVAVPMLRLARGFPLPLLMIAAGAALTSETVRGRAAEAAAPAVDKAGEMINRTAERTQAFASGVKGKVSLAQSHAVGATDHVHNRAGELAEDVRTRAAETVSTLTGNIKDVWVWLERE